MIPLLDLPGEIRAIIINHATSFLPSTRIHPKCLPLKTGDHFNYTGAGRDGWFKVSKCPSLLLICRSLHGESIPSIYNEATIQLLPELLSPRLLVDKPGMQYVKSIDFIIDACFPKGCVGYSELLPAQLAAEVRIYLPQVNGIGLSIRDGTDWSQALPTLPLEKFLGDRSWSSFIRGISLKIEGRNHYALQAFLQSSRISDTRSLSTTGRRTSILSVPFALVQLPKLEELTLNMVTSLSAPGQNCSDPDPIIMESAISRGGRMERYTPSDFLIRNRLNHDFVIALKINDLFHATGKDVSIRVKRCIWTEGHGGYVVEEKSLKQYNRERWASATEYWSTEGLSQMKA